MIDLTFPGQGTLRILNLATVVNGTPALDSVLIDRLAKRLITLRDRLEIHLPTGDLYGCKIAIDELLEVRATRVQSGSEAKTIANFVRESGAETVAAIGQAVKSAVMLNAAALGNCVISKAAMAVRRLVAVDMIFFITFAALDSLDKPFCIVASQRK